MTSQCSIARDEARSSTRSLSYQAVDCWPNGVETGNVRSRLEKCGGELDYK